MMCEGKSAFSCDIPYLCSLDHDLILKEKIEEDKLEIGQVAYDMEYCGKTICLVICKLSSAYYCNRGVSVIVESI